MTNDRLVWLLQRFELRAQAFQAGVLHCGARFPAESGTGYLHLLRSGSVELREPGREVRIISEPCVFFFMNATEHSLQPVGKAASMVCASFCFGLSEGNPLLRALPDMVLVPLRELPLLGLTLRQLFTEASEAHCGRQAILDRLCEVALILLLRELMDQQRLEVGLLAGLSDTRLSKAINAMHAEPGRDWTLEELAACAGMSRARFAVHFRDVVGQTPAAYLAEWRIGLTQSFLLRGKPVKWIADEVGYGSPSALSRAFSSLRGLSPRQWLLQHGQPSAANL